jgi:hypothetical protein
VRRLDLSASADQAGKLSDLKSLDKVKRFSNTAATMRTGTTASSISARTLSSRSIVLVLSILPL